MHSSEKVASVTGAGEGIWLTVARARLVPCFWCPRGATDSV